MTKPQLAREVKKVGRTYAHPRTGETVPSITTVMGQRNKGDALTGWAVKETANAAGDFLYYLANLSPELQAHELEKYKYKKDIEPLKRAWKGARYEQKAPGSPWSPAKTGDLVHDAAENYIVSGGTFRLSQQDDVQKLLSEAEVNEAEALEILRPWLSQFLAWEKRFQPEFLLAEATMWSRTHGYAGTGDLCVRMNGKITWLDIKSGKNLYQEYAMQLEALANADFVLTSEGDEIKAPQADAVGLLHLTPKFWCMQKTALDGGPFTSFLGLLQSLKAEMETFENWFGPSWKGSADAD